MPHYKLFVRLAAVTLASTVLGLPLAYADDPEFPGVAAPTPQAGHWGLGLGASYSQELYRGVGSRTTAIPLILFDNQYVRVFGNMVDFKLPSAGQFHFAVRAKYALGDGYKASQSTYLYGMSERKGGLWLGGAATWDNPMVRLSAQWLKATNDSKGQQFEVGAEHGFHFGRFQLTPHISALRSDSKYVDYYYGVAPDEARVGRAAYSGAAATQVSAGVRVNYVLTKQQMVLIDVADTHRGSGISDSPLVDKASAASLKVGYLYSF